MLAVNAAINHQSLVLMNSILCSYMHWSEDKYSRTVWREREGVQNSWNTLPILYAKKVIGHLDWDSYMNCPLSKFNILISTLKYKDAYCVRRLRQGKIRRCLLLFKDQLFWSRASTIRRCLLYRETPTRKDVMSKYITSRPPLPSIEPHQIRDHLLRK